MIIKIIRIKLTINKGVKNIFVLFFAFFVNRISWHRLSHIIIELGIVGKIFHLSSVSQKFVDLTILYPFHTWKHEGFFFSALILTFIIISFCLELCFLKYVCIKFLFVSLSWHFTKGNTIDAVIYYAIFTRS